MHIEDKLWTSLLSDFMYLYKTFVQTNIEMFVLFIYILFFPEKDSIHNCNFSASGYPWNAGDSDNWLLIYFTIFQHFTYLRIKIL